MKDRTTGAVQRFHKNAEEDTNEQGLALLSSSKVKLGGHNILKYDVPVIQKLYPKFPIDPSLIRDSLIEARLIWPDLKDKDNQLIKAGVLDKKNFNRHSLEAWGQRLRRPKDDYSKRCKDAGIDPWAAWSQDMEDYCVQDVDTNTLLFDIIDKQNYSQEALTLEHEVAWIIARQELYGFMFDERKAVKFYSKLVARKLELEAILVQTFKPFFLRDGKEVIPKQTRSVQVEELGFDYSAPIKVRKEITGYKFKTFGYTEGARYCKIKLVEFNPNSNDHIENRLKKLFGWEPDEYTETGKAKIDDVILSALPYAEAAPLKEHAVVAKRISQLSEGTEAWLKKVRTDTGRIHGSVITNGAVTGRMTHSKPNLAQVPAGYSPYGHECRELFIVPPNKVLVGADAAALELRVLAGYMARLDGGSYVRTVLNGNMDEGTDIHSVNAKALGLDPYRIYFEGESGRDIAKTWFYAFLYGAGDAKLGFILSKTKGAEAIKRGKASRTKFMRNLPALASLIKKIKEAVKERGFLKGLDGRVLHIRSQHSAPNTLFQSAGAVLMKKALVILDKHLQGLGFVPGINYEFVANVHDEWQIEADTDKGETIGKAAVEAIKKAGEHYDFRCPLDGEFKLGRNWSETH